MITVLQVFGEPLDNGGQEAFIMNMYRNIDRSKVQFDFFTPYYCANENLRHEIESMGGHVFEKAGHFDTQGDKKDFVNNLTAFFAEHKYDTVHIHSGSIFSLAMGAKIAKKNGAKKVIVHSHATGNNNLQYKIIKAVSPFLFAGNATDYLACSEIAARWKFPKSVIRRKQYRILKNGIDLQKFSFDESVRTRYRTEMKLENKFVMCHVGRMSPEKNHAFLLDVFEALKKLRHDALLLLIGDGPERHNVEKLVQEKGLANDVILLGKRQDVNALLQAGDVFVFPSLFEGLGIVAIEAQATGLPTLCSEHIPEEANATSLFSRISLSDGPAAWAEKILALPVPEDRSGYGKYLSQCGYDSKEAAYCLQQIYLEGK